MSKIRRMKASELHKIMKEMYNLDVNYLIRERECLQRILREKEEKYIKRCQSIDANAYQSSKKKKHDSSDYEEKVNKWLQDNECGEDLQNDEEDKADVLEYFESESDSEVFYIPSPEGSWKDSDEGQLKGVKELFRDENSSEWDMDGSETSSDDEDFFWVKASEGDCTVEPLFDARVELHSELQHPANYVMLFLTDDFLDYIVCQTNLYSIQVNPQKPLNIDRTELKRWIGICLYSSITKLPTLKMNWIGTDPLNKLVAKIMSYERFKEIASKLHLVNNASSTQDDPNTSDKFWKVRPMIDHLRSKFQQIQMRQNLCIDKQVIPFRCNNLSFKNVGKSSHNGECTFLLLADNEGTIYDFMPFTEGICRVDEPTVPDLKSKANYVLHLAQCIPSDRNHILYFDKQFNSIPLMRHLATRQIWCCGTVKVSKLPGIRERKMRSRKLIRLGEGAYEEFKSKHEEAEITYVNWEEDKVMHFASTFAKTKPIQIDHRTEYNPLTLKNVKIPYIYDQYESNRKGVEYVDELISVNRIDIRLKKYYHRLIYHMIDMVMINSYSLYFRDSMKIPGNRIPIVSTTEFRLKVAFALWDQTEVLRERKSVK